MVELLCDTFEHAPSTTTISGDFATLRAQAEAQFAAEERFLRAKESPQYDACRKQHRQQLKEIRRLAKACEDGRCTECGTNLRACLEVWMANHFRKVDPALRALVH